MTDELSRPDETSIYSPDPDADYTSEHDQMQLGQPGNELYDPFFDTDEGRDWLQRRGEST